MAASALPDFQLLSVSGVLKNSTGIRSCNKCQKCSKIFFINIINILVAKID